MKPPRGLSEAERALWSRVAQTVTPLDGTRPADTPATPEKTPAPASPPPPRPPKAGRKPRPAPAPARPPAPPVPSAGLDSHWERRLKASDIAPDYTLDLHGHSLDQAFRRLEAGLFQAKAMGARVVLVVTGKPRPVDAADRAERRGAIRAKILDWLAAGPHAGDIAAVRRAQRRHGGEGALYLVLKRRR